MLKPTFFPFVFIVCFCTLVSAQKSPDGPYPIDPASERQEGVPEGQLIRGTFSESKIFPGTTREYAIYVPHQYKRSLSLIHI